MMEATLDYGKSILELGSGPGFDLAHYKKHYNVTGSDFSEEFLGPLKNQFKDIPIYKVNAIDMDLNDKFNCIFSNKVLHHLTEKGRTSFYLLSCRWFETYDLKRV